MNEAALIESKDLRNQAIERVEVLDKVKELLLVPNLDVMTTNQVADYYEVENEVIQKCYQRNHDEIDSDGVIVLKAERLSGQDVHVVKERGGNVITVDGFGTFKIPYPGVRSFSKRAVLRIGMLLRDSEIAKEVRTQLLNIVGKAADEVVVADIDEEREILMNIGAAYASGSLERFAKESQRLVNFQNRHITELQQNNKALAIGNLEWEDRSSVNKAVRLMATKLGVPFGFVWKDLYNELLYKHHMNLAMRGKPPLINHVKEDEWKFVQKSLASMCEEKGLSFAKIVERAKLKD